MDDSLDDQAVGNLTSSLAPAQRIRMTMLPARVRYTWLGTIKSLGPAQRSLAVEPFRASGQFLVASK